MSALIARIKGLFTRDLATILKDFHKLVAALEKHAGKLSGEAAQVRLQIDALEAKAKALTEEADKALTAKAKIVESFL